MTVYEDLLTGYKYQEEFVTAEHGFQYKNHELRFEAARIKVEYDLHEKRLIKLDFSARITQTAEALKLRDLFKQSGYTDIREVSALLNTPLMELWINFLAPESLRLQGADTSFFDSQEVRQLFVAESGHTAFNQLSHYELESIVLNNKA